MEYYSISEAIEMAKRMTASCAIINDWRLNRKIDRKMKQAARDLNKGKGYIIASPAKLKEAYPEFVTWCIEGADRDRPIMWAFYAGVVDKYGRYRPSLCPVHAF